MSIHAMTSPHARAALAAQRRNSTISSLLIAILGTFLVGLILFIITMSIEQKTNLEMIPFKTSLTDDPPIEKPQTRTEVERKPTSPTSAMTPTIVANMASAISIPTLDVEATELNLDFGIGDDFGLGDGTDFGTGAGGAASGFGTPTKLSGTLGGFLYDFKQDKRGNTRKDYTVGNNADFIKFAKKFQSSRFKASGLRDHFKAPDELFVRYIAIPFSNANAAPTFFNVQDIVKPSGWMVHYSGKVKAPKSGTFRLVGFGDDYLGAAINNNAKLIAPWPNIRPALEKRGANSRDQPSHKSPFGPNLVYGDWFTLREGETIQLDIGIGENPGGKVGFVLMIEEKGKEYTKGSDGRNILPPLVFGHLANEDYKALREFPGWQFDLNDIPIFQAE
ncbi:hypothetical protein [Rubritalea tangerina]|uniref:PA14 domain-containing protein n=1 Tax=Rubritalea tangerina TaxID=430798 RepID=A0ABW4Z8B2_9BACT